MEILEYPISWNETSWANVVVSIFNQLKDIEIPYLEFDRIDGTGAASILYYNVPRFNNENVQIRIRFNSYNVFFDIYNKISNTQSQLFTFGMNNYGVTGNIGSFNLRVATHNELVLIYPFGSTEQKNTNGVFGIDVSETTDELVIFGQQASMLFGRSDFINYISYSEPVTNNYRPVGRVVIGQKMYSRDYIIYGQLKNAIDIRSEDFATQSASIGGARIKANGKMYQKIFASLWIEENE